MNEYVLGVNKYNTPTILKGNDTICTLLVRLLLLTPGTIQTRPEMGVGLITRWRYSDIENLNDLKLEIENQTSTYLPDIRITNIEVDQSEKDKREIIIKVFVDNTVYAFETNNGELKLYDLANGGK